MALDANGWTIFTPSADSRIVYVSSSTGNNANTGLSEGQAVASISIGISKLRRGYPDWLLLKCGDTFSARTNLTFGGRSASEPMLISSYSTGARPVVLDFGYYASPMLSHLAMVGLKFQGNWPTNTSDFAGITFLGDMQNITFEDNIFTGYQIGIQIDVSGQPSNMPTNIVFRRNIVYDNTRQGFLVGRAQGLTIEENVFDNNGNGANGRTIREHNIYAHSSRNVTLRGNILSRGSNFGSKMSADSPDTYTDFVVENNLYYNNGMSLDKSEGHTGDINTTFTHNRGSVKDNVFTAIGRTYADGGKQDMATWVWNSQEVIWDGNIFTHKPAYAGNSMMSWPGHHKNISTRNSIVYDWDLGGGAVSPGTYYGANNQNIDGYTLIDNVADMPPETYIDPTRTVGSYYLSIGGTNDAVAFMTAAKKQSKSSWNTQLTASAVNNYIRAGFALARPPIDPPVPSTLESDVHEILTILRWFKNEWSSKQ